jgi:hypothetical protein
MKDSGQMGLKFVDPEDCMFAIELEDEEEIKQIDITTVPNSTRHDPRLNGDGQAVNVATNLYAFRALAVAIIDRTAQEVHADILAAAHPTGEKEDHAETIGTGTDEEDDQRGSQEARRAQPEAGPGLESTSVQEQQGDA